MLSHVWDVISRTTVAGASVARPRRTSSVTVRAFHAISALLFLATVTSAQNIQTSKLAPELVYVDPYTGMVFNYVLAGEIAPVMGDDGAVIGEVLVENPALLNSLAGEAGRAVKNAAVLRHPRAAAASAAKRSAGPAAVKRERIIMDALGGDYLIRKRTLF